VRFAQELLTEGPNLSRMHLPHRKPNLGANYTANRRPNLSTNNASSDSRSKPNLRRRGLRALAVLGASALVSTALLGATSAQAAPAKYKGLQVVRVGAGKTPFIANVKLANVSLGQVSAVSFSVQPRPGTVSAAMTGTYSLSYLRATHHVGAAHRTITVPVYGLYDDFTNTAAITLTGPHHYQRTIATQITTKAWVSTAAVPFTDRQAVVARNVNVHLGYSFFMLKTVHVGAHPVVLDTDGYVRWVGTMGDAQQGSTFVGNKFYVGNGSKLSSMTLDGNVTQLNDLTSAGYSNYHHNIDPGRNGLLLELDHGTDVESDIVEVGFNGAVLRTFNFAQIIADTMRAGGDDPSAFVRPGANDDWFHNNSATYWAAQNELVVSSRENFVMGIDYDTKQIKWMLGDPTKAWHQYPTLAALALTVPNGGHYPIGQHALSFTPAGELMLFDNGFASLHQTPAGETRAASAPRRYAIDLTARTATETWSFDHAGDITSPICSSIYQSGDSFLIDYASENFNAVRLMGIDANKNIAFEYLLPGAKWSQGWNALPIHVEDLTYK